MVHRRLDAPAKKPSTRRRANPAGMGRLLTMALTVGFLTLGRGAFWWLGLVLLTLILLAVGRQGHAWWKLGALMEIVAALGFWHLHILPGWAGTIFLTIGAAQFVWSLVPETL